MLFREFIIELTNYPQIDIFLYSHHLSGWYCILLYGEIQFWSLTGAKGLIDDSVE